MAGAASFAMKEQAVKAEQIGEAADIIEAACCCGIPEMVAYATDILDVYKRQPMTGWGQSAQKASRGSSGNT